MVFVPGRRLTDFRYAGSTSTMDHSGGLTGLTGVGVKGAPDADDDSYFGTITSNSRYGSIGPETGTR